MILPSRFYGDPAEVCDERRKLTEIAEKQAVSNRNKKSRRHKRQVLAAKQGRR